MIKQLIHSYSKQLLQSSSQSIQIKPSLQQILLVNHKLKCQQVSQLLKQSIKQQMSNSGQTKLTCYSQCVLMLEHDVNVRLKQTQLETQKNQSEKIKSDRNQKKNSQKNYQKKQKQQIMTQDGIRLIEFNKIFNGKRPKLFCVLVNLLTGLCNEDYQ